ncbi:uncharacterized protein TRIVIDRAFT_206460 [Trichoderma virens Gv29-8]|uniref:F-box domain-containing protein n=1 Tax=Hypocrea virens (strain Gv29-8 / FGSC 10586) TaxID=413071 RepID=G9NAB6_HYPVG|nr:uncharacterized protein TRIVIDRAFT_206460 [Trichoderma virens Gv29-8]EHK16882.1 hypothetical protein TRIVIDRAFT_206460 [Trichoderma virens Gv29-8]UKZ51743.1 hypothetical protein TrVGV298_005506 [Trichoderma virens]
MASITKLPCEVITSVMRDLGNIRFLLPCLLTCRHFYACYRENPSVAADILQQQVTLALVPYSIAVLEASHLNPRTGVAVRELLKMLYTEPSRLANRLRTMPVPLFMKMGHMHDAIHDLASQYSSHAWTQISNGQPMQAFSGLSLSRTEYYRFCRAFYRVELYFSLFRNSTSSNIASFSDDDREWFFSQHAPWENEQLSGAHDFLELKISKASYDILAHDVELGELGIDYLTPGGDNGWRQLFALLKSSFGAGRADLYDALTNPPGEDLDDGIPLSEYTDEDLDTLFSISHSEDANKGPFQAWRMAFNDLPRRAWAMLTNNAGLRERAYVFWDVERLERCGLLSLFEDVSEDSELLSANKDFDGMYESFEERSRIWQKGGLGYWSNDGESRIVWPTRQGMECLG